MCQQRYCSFREAICGPNMSFVGLFSFKLTVPVFCRWAIFLSIGQWQGVSDISLFPSENSVKGEFLKCPFWFLLARFQGGSVRSCLRRPRIFLPHFFLSVVLSFFKCGGVRVLCVLLVPRRDLLLCPLGPPLLALRSSVLVLMQNLWSLPWGRGPVLWVVLAPTPGF